MRYGALRHEGFVVVPPWWPRSRWVRSFVAGERTRSRPGIATLVAHPSRNVTCVTATTSETKGNGMDALLPAELAPEVPVFADELDEALLAGEVVDDQRERWRIDSLGKADWAMRRLAAISKRRRDVDEYADECIAKIERFRAAELQRLERADEFFTGALEAYALEQLRETGTKTVTLPSGTVGTRTPNKPKLHIAVGPQNEAAVLAWCKQNLNDDDFEKVVNTKQTVRVTELESVVRLVKNTGTGKHKAVDPRTGEFIPGVYVTEPGESTAKAKPDLSR